MSALNSFMLGFKSTIVGFKTDFSSCTIPVLSSINEYLNGTG